MNRLPAFRARSARMTCVGVLDIGASESAQDTGDLLPGTEARVVPVLRSTSRREVGELVEGEIRSYNSTTLPKLWLRLLPSMLPLLLLLSLSRDHRRRCVPALPINKLPRRVRSDTAPVSAGGSGGGAVMIA
jgi:hypothetical protein